MLVSSLRHQSTFLKKKGTRINLRHLFKHEYIQRYHAIGTPLNNLLAPAEDLNYLVDNTIVLQI
jgi:hypothetical protein